MRQKRILATVPSNRRPSRCGTLGQSGGKDMQLYLLLVKDDLPLFSFYDVFLNCKTADPDDDDDLDESEWVRGQLRP